MEDEKRLEIVRVAEHDRWNEIVKSFQQWDVYYLNEYACSLQLHGDGMPLLIYFETEQCRLCYAVMQEDISLVRGLGKVLPPQHYFDWSTPYGYGGPLTEGKITTACIAEFMSVLQQWCKSHAVITQFFRFHPLLQNQKVLEDVSDVIYMKKTVYIDTSDKETVFKNMTPNNRNMVRKAEKNGIEIIMDHGERLEDFQRIYECTMRNNHAEEYYYFEDGYFQYLRENLQENMMSAYALYEGKFVSAAIFLYNTQYMHYHLSGTLPEYRSLGATNLLLTKAAYWAAEHGIKKFHLGGGVGIDDSLLFFKKHFNRNGLIDFCIGRNIFDKQRFDELVELRKQNDVTFDSSKSFLIKYRG